MTILTSSTELHSRLGDPNLIVIDCRFNLIDSKAGISAYQKAHIPTARYADLNDDLSSPITATTGRHPLPTNEHFHLVLERLGINEESEVILYDDANCLMASRFWWLLTAYGHEKVSLLNGGIADYQRHYPLTDEIQSYQSSSYPERKIDQLTYYSTDEIEKLVKSGDITLIDVRTNDRYRGENETIDPIAGHIPGAINLPFCDHLDHEEKYLPATQIAENFKKIIALGKPIVFHCGSGVTSCHSFVALKLAEQLNGIEVLSGIYPGSWSEWIRDSSRGIA